MNSTRTEHPLLADIAVALPLAYDVRAGARVLDVRVNPEHALRPDVDMVRVIEDDGTYLIVHMTHNEVIRGEVRVSGSFVGMVPTIVRELVETF